MGLETWFLEVQGIIAVAAMWRLGSTVAHGEPTRRADLEASEKRSSRSWLMHDPVGPPPPSPER
jgi:hypothetical protein